MCIDSHKREKRSTHVNRYFYPSHVWMILLCPRAYVQTTHRVMERIQEVSRSNLALWHGTHFCEHCRKSVFMHDQTNLYVISRNGALACGCDKLCMAEINIFLNDSADRTRCKSMMKICVLPLVRGGGRYAFSSGNTHQHYTHKHTYEHLQSLTHTLTTNCPPLFIH